MFPITMQEGSSQHRLYRLAGFGILAAAMIILPLVLPEFQVTRLNRMVLLSVAILGLNMVVGYNGLLALCHSAFIAMGAFVTASLVSDHNWDYWMTIPASMIISFLLGVIIGIPALRIKGLYLALTTVAFAATFPSLTKLEFFGIADRTGGANGRELTEALNPPGWAQDLGFNLNEPARYRYFMILALGIAAFWAVNNLLKSRPGRAIVAIRDNETGAAVSGVETRRLKVINFGLSASLGGLAGTMWAMNTGFVGETSFTFVLMVELLVGLVIGGVATVSGAVIGAAVVVFVREYTKTLVIGLDVGTFIWLAIFLIVLLGAVLVFQKMTDNPVKPPTALLGLIAGAGVLAVLNVITGGDSWYDIDGNGPLSQAIFGVILILVTFFAPQGVIGAVRKLRSFIVRVIPKTPGEWMPAGAVSAASGAVVDVTTEAAQDAGELAGAGS